VRGGGKVSEADGKHDVDSPVVGPDVFLEPVCLSDSLDHMPVHLSVYADDGS
jgi:hypothetical protein